MKRKLIFISSVLVIAGLLILPVFIKLNIKCNSVEGPCPQEVLTRLKNINSSNLYLVNGRIANELKKDFLITQYSMQFKLPNTLQVNLIVKKAVYSIYSRPINTYFLADSEGTVLSTSDNSSLPLLVTDDPDIKIGANVKDKYLFDLKLLAGTDRMYQIKTGTIENGALVVDLPGNFRVIFPLNGSDQNVLLGGLRLIYAKITSDQNTKYSEVDMRYKNPILR